MEPKPVQKPHLPIIFGGHHENALRRAVKYADGWMGAGSSSAASFVRESARIRDMLAEAQTRSGDVSFRQTRLHGRRQRRSARRAAYSRMVCAAATKMPISVRKFPSGAAPPSARSKSKRSSKPARNRSSSIRCSTKPSIWKSAPRKSCRIFRRGPSTTEALARQSRKGRNIINRNSSRKDAKAANLPGRCCQRMTRDLREISPCGQNDTQAELGARLRRGGSHFPFSRWRSGAE